MHRFSAILYGQPKIYTRPFHASKKKKMKEFTEIEIVDSKVNINSILDVNKFLTFRFENEELKRFIGGSPISKIDEKTIKFSTQGYYEEIPLSMVKSETKLELFDDWKKENKIGNGIIKKRYFEKAVKEDWKIEEEINPLNCKTHKVEITFSDEEKKCLEFGNNPLQMEDKWFSFMENNIIHFFRSWTGIEIFQAEILQIENNKWMIKELRSTKDLKFILLNKKSIFKDLIKFQIERIEKIIK